MTSQVRHPAAVARRPGPAQCVRYVSDRTSDQTQFGQFRRGVGTLQVVCECQYLSQVTCGNGPGTAIARLDGGPDTTSLASTAADFSPFPLCTLPGVSMPAMYTEWVRQRFVAFQASAGEVVYIGDPLDVGDS